MNHHDVLTKAIKTIKTMIRRIHPRWIHSIAATVLVATGSIVILHDSAFVRLYAQQKPQPQPASATATATPNAPASGKAKQSIAQLKKLKLIETLDLNEQMAEKFFVRYNAEQKKVDDATKALNESIRQLEQAIQKKSTSEQLKQLTDQTLDKRTQLYTAYSERYKSLRLVLDEPQYARFLVFEPRFQEQLRRTILDVKRDVKKEAEAAQKK